MIRALVALALLLTPFSARAADCHAALVLALDLSDSVDAHEADLQRKGYNVPSHASDMLKPEHCSMIASTKGKTFAPAKFKAEDSSAAFLVDEAIKYTNGHRAEPWFVHMSFLSPHPPFIAPEPFNSMYDANDMPLPARRNSPHLEAEQHPWLAHYLFNQRGDGYTAGAKSIDNLALSETELRQIRATYFGMMSEVDSQIGRFLSHLKAQGSYDETIIIFTSDHGELLGDHWMLSKFCYFEQVFHVPLIIRLPGAEAEKTRGTIIEAFSESVDVMPTILDSIDVAIPRQCDGRSLLPLCHGYTPENWRLEYHAEFDIRSPYADETERPMGLKTAECMVNIIGSTRFKYVHFSGLPPLFFDLENDPDEFESLFGDPDYSELILNYAGKLLSWRMAHDDPALVHLQLEDDGSVREIG